MSDFINYQKYVNIFNIWKYTGCLNNYIQFMANAKFYDRIETFPDGK